MTFFLPMKLWWGSNVLIMGFFPKPPWVNRISRISPSQLFFPPSCDLINIHIVHGCVHTHAFQNVFMITQEVYVLLNSTCSCGSNALARLNRRTAEKMLRRRYASSASPAPFPRHMTHLCYRNALRQLQQLPAFLLRVFSSPAPWPHPQCPFLIDLINLMVYSAAAPQSLPAIPVSCSSPQL